MPCGGVQDVLRTTTPACTALDADGHVNLTCDLSHNSGWHRLPSGWPSALGNEQDPLAQQWQFGPLEITF